MTGTLHEDQYTLLILSRSVFLRMRNVGQTKVEQKIKTHYIYMISGLVTYCDELPSKARY